MVVGLLKFGNRARMEMFRDEGLLHMKHLRYFIDLEEADQNRSDQHEGLDALYRGELITLTVDGHELSHATGLTSVTMRGDSSEKINIFCMYGLKAEYPYVDPQNLRFGDTVVFILNVREFMVRLRAALTGRKARAELVEYVDKDLHHGSLGPFRKFKTFDYQNEYRVVLLDGEPHPVDLRIGSLRDISTIRDSKNVNDEIRLFTNQLPPKRGA